MTLHRRELKVLVGHQRQFVALKYDDLLVLTLVFSLNILSLLYGIRATQARCWIIVILIWLWCFAKIVLWLLKNIMTE